MIDSCLLGDEYFNSKECISLIGSIYIIGKLWNKIETCVNMLLNN